LLNPTYNTYRNSQNLSWILGWLALFLHCIHASYIQMSQSWLLSQSQYVRFENRDRSKFSQSLRPMKYIPSQKKNLLLHPFEFSTLQRAMTEAINFIYKHLDDENFVWHKTRSIMFIRFWKDCWMPWICRPTAFPLYIYRNCFLFAAMWKRNVKNMIDGPGKD